MLIKISSRPKVLISFSFSLMSNGMQFYTTMLFLIIIFYYWIRRKQTTGTFIICQQKVLFPASSSNAFHNCIKAIREQACLKVENLCKQDVFHVWFYHFKVNLGPKIIVSNFNVYNPRQCLAFHFNLSTHNYLIY